MKKIVMTIMLLSSFNTFAVTEGESLDDYYLRQEMIESKYIATSLFFLTPHPFFLKEVSNKELCVKDSWSKRYDAKYSLPEAHQLIEKYNPEADAYKKLLKKLEDNREYSSRYNLWTFYWFMTNSDLPRTISALKRLVNFYAREDDTGDSYMLVTETERRFYKLVKKNRGARWAKGIRTLMKNREEYKNALICENANRIQMALTKPMWIEEITEVI